MIEPLAFRRRPHAFAFIAMAAMLVGCGPSERSTGEVEAIQALLQEEPAKRAGESEGLLKQTQAFYAARNFAPAWLSDGSRLPSVDSLKQVISAAAAEGLDPTQYGRDRIDTEAAKAQAAGTVRATAEADLYLTSLLLRYSTHLAEGRPISTRISSTWVAVPKELEIGRAAAEALKANELQGFPSQLGAPHEEYSRLTQALEQYRHIAANGGWRPL